MKAVELMHKKVITAGKDTTVKEAAVIMSKNKVSGLPVIDEEGNIEGIVTDSDILKYRQKINMPEYLKVIEYFIEQAHPGELENNIREILAHKVADIMTVKLVTVGETAGLGEIIGKFAEHHISRIPVVKGKKLVGIIAREDVIRAFVERF